MPFLRKPRRTTLTSIIAVGLLTLLVVAGQCTLVSPALAQRSQEEPEAATGQRARAEAVARRHMVVSAHPLATEAGLGMLRAGGSATDAAIATQLVLGLVEPQSSGLGGGAFMLAWTARTRTLSSYDGRETAPAAATPDLFPKDKSFDEIVGSGLSIGVPGVVRLLEAAHRAHGRLPWSRLFEPAIRLAETGFPVSPRLHALLRDQGAARFQPRARAYFFSPDGEPWPAGHRLANPAYAATLRALALQGVEAFYGGPIAEEIVAAARAAPLPSNMTLMDLAQYRAKTRPAVCFPYRARRICSMGPPSSGGLALGQILGLLQPFHLEGPRKAVPPASSLHLVAEAEKLAYADRDHYIADPDAVEIPRGLLDMGYLATRRSLISPSRAMPRPEPGRPPGLGKRARGEDATHEAAGTSHLSVIDRQGNAVAMTTTIEAAFGSRVWAAGFLLNNQLTDFSLRPVGKDGHPAANGAGPGKRPRSSMAPTIVLDRQGRAEAVLGSPGGSRIILYVAKALVAMIDWRLGPQAAAALPNFGSRGGQLELERAFEARLPAPVLRSLGHEIRADEMTSGLHIILRRGGRLLGGADPRREGLARGD